MATLYPDPVRPAPGLDRTDADPSIHTPPAQDFDTPAMAGSIQQFLADNLGQYVVIEFLVGTQAVETKSGVLYAVGTSVVTLYQELSQTFVTCDIFSIKFVTFYLPGHRPWQVNLTQPGAGMLPRAVEQDAAAPGYVPGVDAVPGDLPAQTGARRGSYGCGGAPSWG